jgi:hypothetical protein
MTSATSSVSSNPAAEWQNTRTLYPLYIALAREFVIDVPACSELADDVDAPSLQSIGEASQWLLTIDGQIQVHQLRQFLQTTSLTGAAALGALLFHHLGKAERTDSDPIATRSISCWCSSFRNVLRHVSTTAKLIWSTSRNCFNLRLATQTSPFPNGCLRSRLC